MSDVSSSSCVSTSPPSPLSSPKSKRRRLVSDLMGDTSVSGTACALQAASSRSLIASSSSSSDDVGLASSSKFYVRSNNEGFQCRQSSVFDMLNDLEAKHSNDIAAWKTSTVDDILTNDDDDELGIDQPPVPVKQHPIDVEPDFADDVNSPSAELLLHPSKAQNELADQKNQQQSLEDEVLPVDASTSSSASASDAPVVFKVPIGLPLKRMKNDTMAADYTVHPEKWTKYTLADVNDDCMSENANSAAAIDFLSGRWKVGSDYDDGREDVDKSDVEGSSGDENDVSGLKHKWVKPEYVVGAARSSSAGGSSSTSLRCKVLGNDLNVQDSTTKPVCSVQLSFLNCTKQGYFNGDDGEDASANGLHQQQKVEVGADEQIVASGQTDPDDVTASKRETSVNNMTFRPVRKRQRNPRLINTSSARASADDQHQDDNNDEVDAKNG